MRKRTPSEIKAYGDGYAEAYKLFQYLIERYEIDIAVRKMKIFADAVALTVEIATDEERSEQMADMMMFPDTWEEFEESYGFTDKEQIYTNGSRLIPSFRVKQWLEHLESKQRQADTPQTETKGVRYCNECKWFRNKQVCGRCRSRNLFAEADTPQTERMTEEEIDTMLAKVLVGQTDSNCSELPNDSTDCSWRQP